MNEDGSLIVSEVNSEDAGNYTCFVSNVHGSDSIEYRVRVLTPPLAPTVEIKESSFEALRLSWTALHDGGSAIRGLFVFIFRPSTLCTTIIGKFIFVAVLTNGALSVSLL